MTEDIFKPSLTDPENYKRLHDDIERTLKLCNKILTGFQADNRALSTYRSHFIL